MRIATLNTKDSFGGAARVAVRLCEETIEQGINNKLFVNSKRSSSSFVYLVSDFHAPRTTFKYYVDKLKFKYRERVQLKRWAKYPDRLDKVFADIDISHMKNALDKQNFDLIHMHWVGDNFLNFKELRKLNKPIVWTLHDCFAFTGVCSYFEDCDKYKTHCDTCPQLRSEKKHDQSWRVFEMKLKRYSSLDFHIVTPSKWLGECVKESFLLKKFPVTVIPNGINTHIFKPIDRKKARESLSIDPNKKVILFGGISAMADPRKGGDILAKALEELENVFSKDEILLLVFGSEKKEDYSFNFETKYLGYIQDESYLNTVYNLADVMVVPSRHENLPNTILESLSSGTPVVAFNIGGNSDMIVHKENGYLASAYDVFDLANGIQFCLQNNQGLLLSENARQKVLASFKLEDIAQQYISLYNEILVNQNQSK